jgi:hypothetical protein
MAFDFPASPTTGTLYQPSGGPTYRYDGAVWSVIGAQFQGAMPSDAAPSNPVPGQLWWESDTGALFIYYDDGNSQQWVQVNPGIAVAGAYERIAVGTAAAVPSLDFINLSAFRMLRITGHAYPVANPTALGLRTSTNNGTSYDAGGTDYVQQELAQNVSTVSGAGPSTSGLSLSSYAQIIPANGIQFVIDFSDFNRSGIGYIKADTLYMGASLYRSLNGGYRNLATARNAFRLYFSSGNIASAAYALEGIRG